VGILALQGGEDVNVDEDLTASFDATSLYRSIKLFEDEDEINITLERNGVDYELQINNDTVVTGSEGPSDRTGVNVAPDEVKITVRDGYQLKEAFQSRDLKENPVVFGLFSDWSDGSNGRRRKQFTIQRYQKAGESPNIPPAVCRLNSYMPGYMNSGLKEIAVNARAINRRAQKYESEYVEYSPCLDQESESEQMHWAVYDGEDLWSFFSRTVKSQLEGAEYSVDYRRDYPVRIARIITEYGASGGESTLVQMVATPHKFE